MLVVCAVALASAFSTSRFYNPLQVASRSRNAVMNILATEEEALKALDAAREAGGPAAAAAPPPAPAEGGGAEKDVKRSLSMLKKGLGAKLGKLGQSKAGAPAAAEDDGVDPAEQLEMLAAAFSAERAQMAAERDRLQKELAAAQEAGKHVSITPEQQEWQSLQTALQKAREEREVAREQLHVLGEQLDERTEKLTMMQASEAMLKADLAALRDDQAGGGRQGEPSGEAAKPGATKGLKGWGDRVKEMKERAEKAKAKVQNKM